MLAPNASERDEHSRTSSGDASGTGITRAGRATKLSEEVSNCANEAIGTARGKMENGGENCAGSRLMHGEHNRSKEEQWLNQGPRGRRKSDAACCIPKVLLCWSQARVVGSGLFRSALLSTCPPKDLFSSVRILALYFSTQSIIRAHRGLIVYTSTAFSLPSVLYGYIQAFQAGALGLC